MKIRIKLTIKPTPAASFLLCRINSNSSFVTSGWMKDCSHNLSPPAGAGQPESSHSTGRKKALPSVIPHQHWPQDHMHEIWKAKGKKKSLQSEGQCRVQALMHLAHIAAYVLGPPCTTGPQPTPPSNSCLASYFSFSESEPDTCAVLWLRAQASPDCYHPGWRQWDRRGF